MPESRALAKERHFTAFAAARGMVVEAGFGFPKIAIAPSAHAAYVTKAWPAVDSRLRRAVSSDDELASLLRE